jgi:hypothetical protein
MNVTAGGSGALSSVDLSMPGFKGIDIAFWGFWTSPRSSASR